MAKKNTIPVENMTLLERALNPDFSDEVRDGKFDAVYAFEGHIGATKVFLSAAMALLEGHPAAGDALSLLRLVDVALDRGIEEAYRFKDLATPAEPLKRLAGKAA